MGHSVLATTWERRERYIAEGRECRMDGRCYSRATHVLVVDDNGIGAWTFCRKHTLQFVESAKHFGYVNAANTESRLLAVAPMGKDEDGKEAKADAICAAKANQSIERLAGWHPEGCRCEHCEGQAS